MTVLSTFRIISALPHIAPPVSESNKCLPSATITDDNEKVLSDLVPVKLLKSKQKCARNEADVFFLPVFFDNPCSSQLFSFVTDDSCDDNKGMHRDVNVMYLLIRFLCYYLS
jgi:hypothetical protein